VGDVDHDNTYGMIIHMGDNNCDQDIGCDDRGSVDDVDGAM